MRRRDLFVIVFSCQLGIFTISLECARVPGRHLVLFVLFGSGVVIGRGLPHNVCHSHIERLVGWERDVASQQGRLLHDGIVMAAMWMGIPGTQTHFMRPEK